MPEQLDLSVVAQARIDLEARRLDGLAALTTEGRAADVVEALAGDRLRAIVANQRTAIARHNPARVTFAKLAELQQSTDRISSEGLALALGAIARDAGLDEGACARADAFVAWLAGKVDRRFARMSVPSGAEAVHRSTDVIRLRVPSLGLWDLPVVAHEFGHLIAAGLTTWDTRGDVIGTPVQTELTGLTGKARSRATELFCDVFATWALGPSFLCTQVFHRFDPTAPESASSDASHPSDASRIYAVQTVLNRMRNGERPHSFDTQIYWADAAWQQMQSDDSVLTPETQGMVFSEVARWMAILTADLGGFRYTWSPTIAELVRHVRAPEAEPAPVDGFSPADVLNAAWLVRLGAWFKNSPAPPDYENTLENMMDASLATKDRHA